MSVAISVDGQTIVSGSIDKTIWIWVANSGTEHFGEPSHEHEHSVYSVAINADGQTIVSVFNDKTFRFVLQKPEPQCACDCVRTKSA